MHDRNDNPAPSIGSDKRPQQSINLSLLQLFHACILSERKENVKEFYCRRFVRSSVLVLCSLFNVSEFLLSHCLSWLLWTHWILSRHKTFFFSLSSFLSLSLSLSIRIMKNWCKGDKQIIQGKMKCLNCSNVLIFHRVFFSFYIRCCCSIRCRCCLWNVVIRFSCFFFFYFYCRALFIVWPEKNAS